MPEMNTNKQRSALRRTHRIGRAVLATSLTAGVLALAPVATGIGVAPASAAVVDTDNDGLSDTYENSIGSSPTNADTDGDKLRDGLETNILRSATQRIDTDGDRMTDYEEAMIGMAPDSGVDRDEDGDTLVTSDENLGANSFNYITHPGKADTDGDGKSDYTEMNVSPYTSPLYNNTTKQGTTGKDWRLMPQYVDGDKDGLPNVAEPGLGTNSTNVDTDGDGYQDGLEVNTLHTDPKAYTAPLAGTGGSGGIQDGPGAAGPGGAPGGAGYTATSTQSATAIGSTTHVGKVTASATAKRGRVSVTVKRTINGHVYRASARAAIKVTKYASVKKNVTRSADASATSSATCSSTASLSTAKQCAADRALSQARAAASDSASAKAYVKALNAKTAKAHDKALYKAKTKPIPKSARKAAKKKARAKAVNKILRAAGVI